MIHPLQLRYDPASGAAAAAWFLPGDSVARWLEELTRCGLAGMDTRLFVVPRSAEDRSAAGLLVVPANPKDVAREPVGIACRLAGERLFLPADAVLYPPVSDAELRRLIILPAAFYHPVFGLSGFEAESVLRISDLIQLPGEQAGQWNFARPGLAPMPELAAIVLLQPPTIEDIFGGAEEDIGSEPIMDLPPAADEPGEGPASQMGRKLSELLAKGLSGMLRQLPHTGSRRTWINDLEDWANQRLRGVNEQLERLRNKELHRLLKLLETDPETGLRHAIPMNSFAHRGIAPPGFRLGSHSLNFDPLRLGGGRADFWNIPIDLQETLRRRYREAADREIQLGRFRRAAYIYAELLGDLPSAANALKRGQLFREAALLYEEHLKNPLEAARCFAEGGLLDEAIQRYEKLGHWLEVADLYVRAGNPTAASAAVRRVVDQRLAQHDVLGAAKLVEERLQAPDEALELLLGAWPGHGQAVTALGAAFRLLARLGRHEPALERLARLNREPVPDGLVLPLASTLTGAAREYPHERFRHHAADLTRVLVSRQLRRTGIAGTEIQHLLDCLVRLAPKDRLLTRDVNRYLAAGREAELRKRRAAPSPADGSRPVVHRTFELPRQMEWLYLRREWHWFFALGVAAKRLTVVRGVWEGDFQSLSWDCPGVAVKQGFVFEPTAEQGRAIALARPGSSAFAQKRFPASDRFFNQECVVGTPSWLPATGYPFAIGEDSVWSVHVASNRAILSCFDKKRGQLLRTIDVTTELLTEAKRDEHTHLAIAVIQNAVAVALGSRLVVTHLDGTLMRVELPGQAVGLVAALPHTRRGVAVMLHQGAVIYWIGGRECVELDRDIVSPMAAFVPGGPLVLASGLKLQLFDVNSQGVQSVSRLELSGQRIAGVSATTSPGEFAVLGERGQVTLFRMPR